MAVWTTPNTKEINYFTRWDAEAFSPVLRSLDYKFRKSPRLMELASVTHPAEIPRTYSNEKNARLFLLAQNIRPLLPDTTTEFRIAPETADGIPVNRLKHADVLVTRSGANSGMCAVYLGGDGDCYTSGEGVIVRSRGAIDGAYLAVFLNTSAGQALCRRAIYGSGQPHIGPKYLEQARVPRLGKIEEQASELVRAAYSDLKTADKLYPEAEVELLDRMGWEELRRQPVELSYVRGFADLTTATRTDAEFFQPQYKRLYHQLKKCGARSVGAFCTKPSRGIQPILVERGGVVVVDSKAVRPLGVEPTPTERTTHAFYAEPKNAKGRVRRGDVLLNSTGRGTLGRAACYQLDVPALCDNHVAILRPDPKVCHPNYLALFLNSSAGLAQSEQFQTGSSGQIEIYPEHIRQFLIFLPCQKNGTVDLAWQEALGAKVKAAGEAKAVAGAKLEEAKRLVERAIEDRSLSRPAC